MVKKEIAFATPDEVIINQIYLVREQKVMIDRDLAVLYGVETKRLKEAVKRNMLRFTEDFMFKMSKQEFENWRTQFATSNSQMSIHRAKSKEKKPDLKKYVLWFWILFAGPVFKYI